MHLVLQLRLAMVSLTLLISTIRFVEIILCFFFFLLIIFLFTSMHSVCCTLPFICILSISCGGILKRKIHRRICWVSFRNILWVLSECYSVYVSPFQLGFGLFIYSQIYISLPLYLFEHSKFILCITVNWSQALTVRDRLAGMNSENLRCSITFDVYFENVLFLLKLARRS